MRSLVDVRSTASAVGVRVGHREFADVDFMKRATALGRDG